MAFCYFCCMNDEIAVALTFLKLGKTILYPTDTIWGIGCDATDEVAVSKVFEIKKRQESKSLVILVNSLDMLGDYIEHIPKKAIEILNEQTRPTTIIYSHSKGLAKSVIASDNTVAIRIVQNEFCKELIKKFGKPIVSTSANISGTSTPMSFSEISPAILNAVDYVVALQREEKATKSSKIIKIHDDGSVYVLRD